MELQILTRTPVLNSSTYSKMTILENYTVKEHAALVGFLTNAGYEQLFKNYEKSVITCVYKKDEEIVTVCRNSAKSEVRVMWEDAKYNSLDTITAPETVGDGETTLSQIGVGGYGHCTDDPMIGLHYLIKNSDGKAIILDGGIFEENADDIYKALESHNIAKDESGKFIITAWIFTHAHGDHIGAFNQFSHKYNDKATVEYIMYNFPGDGRVATREANFDAFEKNIDEQFPEAKRIVPRIAQIYYFGNIKITIACSPDMLYTPTRVLPYFNDTSIYFILEAEGVKTLFLGDGGEMCAEKTLECFRPTTLKSHFVQITHHGLYTSAYKTPYTADEATLLTREERNAREAERHVHENLTKLYETAAPSIGLWPMGDTLGHPRNGRTTVMRDWSRTYGQVAHFVDIDSPDSGYDGVNIVRKGDLITYTMSSEDKLMITKFLLKDGKAELITNQTYESFLAE
ncbi:MAG: MBL fold metallo-hydrolase [Ruminococcaceae bacterium]|nr:MBL fold metallo-hydrolase [Oscillospiraceae bacterium]